MKSITASKALFKHIYVVRGDHYLNVVAESCWNMILIEEYDGRPSSF
jgi:hypothetical protein